MSPTETLPESPSSLLRRQTRRLSASAHDFALEVADSFSAAAEKVGHSVVCALEELKEWQRDNTFILSGYRRETFSFRKAYASLLYLHNESVNIWSHLIGALLFLVMTVFGVSYVINTYPHTTLTDVSVLVTFFISAVFCLALSSTYHTISCVSQSVDSLGRKLDYFGIVALIVGSFIPTLYFGFYCKPQLMKFYSGMIVTLGLGVLTFSVFNIFSSPSFRSVRAFLFAALGLSGIAPVSHGVYIYSFEQLSKQIAFPWILLESLLYISGACVYASRIPERFRPGKHDIWGHSHQIFHFFVLLGSSAGMMSLFEAYSYWHSFPVADRCPIIL